MPNRLPLTSESAVATYTSLLDAWNRRDADAFAAFFTETGTSIGFDGSEMRGREDISTQLSDIFAHHATAAYHAKVREVRSLGGGVVLVRAVVGMVPPGQTKLNPATNAIHSAVLVEGPSDSFEIAHFQNTPAAYHGRPRLVEELTAELTAVARSGSIVETG